MWNQIDPARIFAAELILSLLLFYFAYLQLRRLKYRRIAGELGAEYRSQGPFKNGEIAGSVNGRKYSIQTRTFQKTTWTTFAMNCVNNGIPVYLSGHFFKDFPNWKFAHTTGDKGERVPFTNLTVSIGYVSLGEKYHSQVQRLFQETAPVHSEWLSKWRNSVEIKQRAVSYSEHGVLKNVAVARQILSFLAKVADCIEAEPVRK
jgi:hypothetical protein